MKTADSEAPEINTPHWPMTFVHRFKGGIQATARVAESGTFAVEWDPWPRPGKFRKLATEYAAWRTMFLGKWSEITGREAIVVDLLPSIR